MYHRFTANFFCLPLALSSPPALRVESLLCLYSTPFRCVAAAAATAAVRISVIIRALLFISFQSAQLPAGVSFISVVFISAAPEVSGADVQAEKYIYVESCYYDKAARSCAAVATIFNVIE